MSGNFNIYMRDFLTFRVKATDAGKKYLHECKDSESETGYSLLTYVDATHSGVVNGNMRFYRPDLMAAGVHTWVDKKRPKKPVLRNHDEESDPIGRIVTAKYIDTKHEYVGKYPSISNLLFYDSVSSKRMDLFKSVDLIYNSLQRRNRDYAGLGYTQLGLDVTNPDAIAKIQREEYTTVSVGFKTDAAICAVCHQDWSADGRCEHRLGEMVDGKRVFLISGNFENEECSFVTFPADPFAAVTNIEVLARAKDSMAMRVFLLGQSFDEEVGLFHMTDSLPAAGADMLESDIRFVSDEAQKDTDMDLDEIRKEINGGSLTKERALEIRKELEGNKDAKRLLTSLNAKIKKNDWDSVPSDLTKDAVELRISGLKDAVKGLSKEDRGALVNQLEADAKVFDLSVPSLEEELQVGGIGDPVRDSRIQKLAGELKFTDSEQGKGFVSAVEKMGDEYDKLPEEEKYAGLRLIYQIWDILGDKNSLEWLKKRLSADPAQSDAIYDKAEIETLHDGLEAYEKENKTLKSSVDSLRTAQKVSLTDQKKTIATTIVTYAILAKETGFVGLADAQIADAIEERAQRQLVSLQDSLKDLQKKLSLPVLDIPNPSQTQDAPATEASTEIPLQPVQDSAQVPADPNQQPAAAAAPAPREQDTVLLPRLMVTDVLALQKAHSRSRYLQLKAETEKKVTE